jgi:hypothetical protein
VVAALLATLMIGSSHALASRLQQAIAVWGQPRHAAQVRVPS